MKVEFTQQSAILLDKAYVDGDLVTLLPDVDAGVCWPAAPRYSAVIDAASDMKNLRMKVTLDREDHEAWKSIPALKEQCRELLSLVKEFNQAKRPSSHAAVVLKLKADKLIAKLEQSQ